MADNDAPRGRACMDPRGLVGRIYKEDHYTLLHTKYGSSGLCGLREEDGFYYICPIASLLELMTPLGGAIVSLLENDPWGSAIFHPRGMIDTIYKEHH